MWSAVILQFVVFAFDFTMFNNNQWHEMLMFSTAHKLYQLSPRTAANFNQNKSFYQNEYQPFYRVANFQDTNVIATRKKAAIQ